MDYTNTMWKFIDVGNVFMWDIFGNKNPLKRWIINCISGTGNCNLKTTEFII